MSPHCKGHCVCWVLCLQGVLLIGCSATESSFLVFERFVPRSSFLDLRSSFLGVLFLDILFLDHRSWILYLLLAGRFVL
jgi:hypothetical protein